MRGFSNSGILLAVLVVLSGCATEAAKSIDGTVSEYMGLTCSSQNIAVGEDYCTRPGPDLVQEKIHCYKSLGKVDCYREPNPYETEQSVRVRQVLALGSEGAEIMTVEEYELRQIMRKNRDTKDK